MGNELIYLIISKRRNERKKMPQTHKQTHTGKPIMINITSMEFVMMAKNMEIRSEKNTYSHATNESFHFVENIRNI